MSTTVKQFHEEEAIGKTYDWQIARRLLRYLKPYSRLLIPTLVLTLVLNLLGILQPKFTQYAIDWFIIPRKTEGITLFALIFVAVQLARFVFSYFQSVLLNSVGQYVMFDLRREIYDKLQHQEVAYYDRSQPRHDAAHRIAIVVSNLLMRELYDKLQHQEVAYYDRTPAGRIRTRL